MVEYYQHAMIPPILFPGTLRNRTEDRRGEPACCLPLLLLLLLCRDACGLEVDCRACDFCRGRPDLKDEITARIRKHIADGKTAEEIAMLEGGLSILRPPIEEWANRHAGAVRPAPEKLKYRGSHLPTSGLLTAIEPCVKVNGVCIGTEKLGHLFQQGWEYYRISVLDGKGDRMAERYGEWLEGKEPRGAYAADEAYFRRQHSGACLGYGGYGRSLSCVISNADLAANKAGLQMYKDLQAGRFKSIADYVDSQWCEEANLNEYTPQMEAIIRLNGRK